MKLLRTNRKTTEQEETLGNFLKMLGVLSFTILAVNPSGAETISVGGSGSPIPLTQELAKAFLAKNLGHEIEVLPRSIGEAGGIAALKEGRIQLGIIARGPDPGEGTPDMRFRLYAKVPAVLAVNETVQGVQSLTEQQILDIYAGRITNWKQVGGPDARIQVLTRNEEDMNKRAWRRHLKGFKELQETKDAVMLFKAHEMVAALSNQPYSIGLTDSIGVNEGKGRLRALSVKGVAPTAENVATGQYWIVKEFYAITKGEPPVLAKRFVDFLFSTEGQQIVARFGAVPVK
jgi:phosphate transport system substrate-binding protein